MAFQRAGLIRPDNAMCVSDIRAGTDMTEHPGAIPTVRHAKSAAGNPCNVSGDPLDPPSGTLAARTPQPGTVRRTLPRTGLELPPRLSFETWLGIGRQLS